MANLVPLHVDKDTGNLVAVPNVGGGGPSGPGVLNPGFLHEQLISSTFWAIDHFQDNTNLICQVYDDSDEFILPDKIKIINNDRVEITFGAPMTGTARLVFF